jgi:hypothetical protein
MISERTVQQLVDGVVPAMAQRIVAIETICGRLAGAVELLAESTTAHAGAMALIELAVNASSIKARILDLRRAADQARDAQAKLDADTRKHAAEVEAFSKEKGRVAKLEADLKAAEAEVVRLETQINEAAAARMRNGVPPKSTRTERVGPGGLTRSVFEEPERVRDAHYS